MPKYEMAIAVVDEAEAHRKNQGDIVGIVPYPNIWGRKEIDEYLILIIEDARSLSEIRKAFCQDIFKNGDERKTRYEVSLLSEVEQKNWAFEKKNAFRNDIDELKKTITDLDMAKMENKTIKYQPCKKASEMVIGADDIQEEDVDTVSVVAGKEEEISINLSTYPDLIKSNITGESVA